MKTEKQITDSLEKTKQGIENNINHLYSDVKAGNWNEAENLCFTIIANICAVIAAERILN